MAEENVLRERLRKEWRGPGELAWVEAASGGTVGLPDVFIPLGLRHGYMPVELKWWEVGRVGTYLAGSVKMTARPAQIRFHRLAAEAKQRSAFLALLSLGDIVLLPGNRFPASQLSCVDLDEAAKWMIYLPIEDFTLHLRESLLDEKFWRGKNR